MDGPAAGVSRTADVSSLPSTNRAGADRGAAVSAAASIDSMHLTGEAHDLKAMEQSLDKSSMPFDQARVDKLRAAIADGSYRVDAQKIARGMIELESELLR